MTRGMVCGAQPEAVEAGAVVLQKGGNAIDAAVACALVQGVVDPVMTGIGGVGSAQVTSPRQGLHHCYNFLGHVPEAASETLWADQVEAENSDGYGFRLRGRVNEVGHQSVITPTNLLAYYELARDLGSLEWPDLVAPAIEHAKRGRIVRPHVLAYILQDEARYGRLNTTERLQATEACRRLFFDTDGALFPLGAIVPNPDLADTLGRIAANGASELHGDGETAERVAEDMKRHNGLITIEDLKASQVLVQPPIRMQYRGYEVAGSALPTSGLMVLIMLNILSHFDLRALGHNSPEYLRVLTETMKYATQDRVGYFGDPRFVGVPVDFLLSEDRAAERAARIRAGEKTDLVRAITLNESKTTTQVCTIDEHGNAVSMTHTLGPTSGVVTPGLGFLYNACMSIFDPRPGHPSSIAPGRGYQSSIAPTMIFDKEQLKLVIGAPGATHIPLGVLQGIVNVLDFDMDMQSAVSAPRISVTSDAIDVSNRIPSFCTSPLESAGYTVRRSPLSYAFAGVHGIHVQTDGWQGGADPGRDGMALAV